MCDEAACLHSKAEFRWCCFAPSFHAGFGREAIKTVVDFDCIEMADVPTEILLGRKLGGIEISPPVTVMPAGSAYDHACGYRRPRSVHVAAKKDVRPQANNRRLATEGNLGTVHRT